MFKPVQRLPGFNMPKVSGWDWWGLFTTSFRERTGLGSLHTLIFFEEVRNNPHQSPPSGYRAGQRAERRFVLGISAILQQPQAEILVFSLSEGGCFLLGNNA